MSRSGMAILAAIGCQAAAMAQAPAEIEKTKGLWNPELMMSRACDGIASHYRLNPEQKAQTCKMLTDRVGDFLDRHDKELWPLLTDLLPFQVSGQQPDAETARRVSSKGYRIFLDAKQEILRAQDDFRKLLSEEQKKIHDRDLKGLHRQFSTLDRTFQAWRSGDARVGNPLGQVRLAGGVRLTPQPLNSVHARPVPHESKWEKYVHDFIRKYHLDESQKRAALTVLKDVQDQAAQYRKSHEKDFQAADTLLRQVLVARPPKTRDIEHARRIKDLLHKPFSDWFDELKRRLDQIPTEKQKAEYAGAPGRSPAAPKQPPARGTAPAAAPPPRPEPAPKPKPKSQPEPKPEDAPEKD